MTRATEAVGWLLIVTGVVLVLVALACTFVFLVMMPPEGGDTSYHPEVRPPAAQPGPPVPNP